MCGIYIVKLMAHTLILITELQIKVIILKLSIFSYYKHYLPSSILLINIIHQIVNTHQQLFQKLWIFYVGVWEKEAHLQFIVAPQLIGSSWS